MPLVFYIYGVYMPEEPKNVSFKQNVRNVIETTHNLSHTSDRAWLSA